MKTIQNGPRYAAVDTVEALGEELPAPHGCAALDCDGMEEELLAEMVQTDRCLGPNQYQ